jgi:hypothetical protein
MDSQKRKTVRYTMLWSWLISGVNVQEIECTKNRNIMTRRRNTPILMIKQLAPNKCCRTHMKNAQVQHTVVSIYA